MLMENLIFICQNFWRTYNADNFFHMFSTSKGSSGQRVEFLSSLYETWYNSIFWNDRNMRQRFSKFLEMAPCHPP